MTDVSFDEKAGNGPKEVTVKFPWYRLFYSLDSDTQADVLESAIATQVSNDGGIANSTANANISARNGRTIQLISSILKAIRASVEAEASTN